MTLWRFQNVLVTEQYWPMIKFKNLQIISWSTMRIALHKHFVIWIVLEMASFPSIQCFSKHFYFYPILAD